MLITNIQDGFSSHFISFHYHRINEEWRHTWHL